MPNFKKCCHGDEPEVRVESLTLDDGRRAERHVSVNENGQEVVEIFAEEKRPLKLEKKIQREFKTVVAREVHQTVKDGAVVLEEVRSVEPEPPLQLINRLGVADHAKVVDGDYVRKEDLPGMISDGVVAGVSALMERIEPVKALRAQAQPMLMSQVAVEQNVDDKNKHSMIVNAILGVVIVGQLLFFGYWFLM